MLYGRVRCPENVNTFSTSDLARAIRLNPKLRIFVHVIRRFPRFVSDSTEIVMSYYNKMTFKLVIH